MGETEAAYREINIRVDRVPSYLANIVVLVWSGIPDQGLGGIEILGGGEVLVLVFRQVLTTQPRLALSS